MRNPDCRNYQACLDQAAKGDRKLDCGGCHLEFDRGGKLRMDSEEWIVEAMAAARLLNAIFFWPDDLFNENQ